MRLLVGLAFSALGNGLTPPLLIVYLHEIRGIPTTTAGMVVAWIAAVQSSFTPVVGWLIDRFGPRPVLMQGLVVEAPRLRPGSRRPKTVGPGVGLPSGEPQMWRRIALSVLMAQR